MAPVARVERAPQRLTGVRELPLHHTGTDSSCASTTFPAVLVYSLDCYVSAWSTPAFVVTIAADCSMPNPEAVVLICFVLMVLLAENLTFRQFLFASQSRPRPYPMRHLDVWIDVIDVKLFGGATNSASFPGKIKFSPLA